MKYLFYLALPALMIYGYRYWDDLQYKQFEQQSMTANGFVQIATLANVSDNEVLVFAPINCSSDEAKQAKQLSEELNENNIPHRLVNSLSYEMREENKKLFDHTQRYILSHDPPIVYINGYAKSQPSVEQVMNEISLIK